MLDGFTSHITNTSKEFSQAPEMSLSEIPSQPRMLLENPVSRITFEKLQGFRNTHRMRHFNKQMHIIRLYTQLINLKSMLISNFPNRSLANLLNLIKLKWVPSIFALPNEVKRVLTHRMLKMCKFHFFSSCAKFKNTANTTTYCSDECADSVAHSLYSLQNLRSYRRSGIPSAKAQGILCM